MPSCIDIIATTFVCISFSFKAYILVCFLKAKIYKEVNNIIQQIERKVEYIQKFLILSCMNQLVIQQRGFSEIVIFNPSLTLFAGKDDSKQVNCYITFKRNKFVVNNLFHQFLSFILVVLFFLACISYTPVKQSGASSCCFFLLSLR